MMIEHLDPDGYVTVIESHRCPHHQREPWDTSWAGCTCSSSYSTRKATPAERAENIKKREAEEERRRKHMADYDAAASKEAPPHG